MILGTLAISITFIGSVVGGLIFSWEDFVWNWLTEEFVVHFCLLSMIILAFYMITKLTSARHGNQILAELRYN